MLLRYWESLHTADDDLGDGTGVGVATSGDTFVSSGVLDLNLVEYQSGRASVHTAARRIIVTIICAPLS